MSMSKKEFEAIAAAIYDAEIDQDARTEVAMSVADALVSQSDSFHVPLFLRGCGVTGELPSLETLAEQYSTRLAIRVSGQQHRASTRAS